MKTKIQIIVSESQGFYGQSNDWSLSIKKGKTVTEVISREGPKFIVMEKAEELAKTLGGTIKVKCLPPYTGPTM